MAKKFQPVGNANAPRASRAQQLATLGTKVLVSGGPSISGTDIPSHNSGYGQPNFPMPPSRVPEMRGLTHPSSQKP